MTTVFQTQRLIIRQWIPEYVVVRPENHASIRVAQRLAMMPMGRTHKYYGVELELFKLDC